MTERCKNLNGWLRLVLGLTAIWLVAVLPAIAYAAGNDAARSLVGQVRVGGGREDPQLLLDAAEADPAGWQLKATLVPSRTGRGRSLAQLDGQFTMAAKGTPILDGTTTGQLDLVSGRGALVLTLPDGTPVNAAFTVKSSAGDLQMSLTGNLPAPARVATTKTADNPMFWYLSRTAGFVAYLLLFVNVCLGLSVRTGFLDETLPRWRSFDLHQLTALLATGLVLLHVFSLLGDHFIGFSLSQLLIPGLAAYRPFWIAVGILCSYALSMVVASFYLRRFIGHGAWRALHYVTFVLFFAALGHGVFAGSDAAFWTNLTYFLTGAIVALLAIARFWGPWSQRAVPRAYGNFPESRARDLVGDRH